jgi:hypothetical protein
VALVMQHLETLGGNAAPPGAAGYIDAYVGICLRTSASIADPKTIRKLWRLYTGTPPIADLPYLALGLLPPPAVRRTFALAKQMRLLGRAIRRGLAGLLPLKLGPRSD